MDGNLIKISLRTLLLILAVIFIYQQICFQFPRTTGGGSPTIASVFHSLRMNLRLSHMFSPFEDSLVGARIVFRNTDGSEHIRTLFTYRAPFRRSLSNLIEARLILNNKEGHQSLATKGYVRHLCASNTQRQEILFQKAYFHINEILIARGSFEPIFRTIGSFKCS